MRFPDFQVQLPEHQLGDIATFRKGKGVSKADIVEDGQTPCVRYGELYTTYGQVIDEPVSKTNLPDAELLFSQANDVVIPASGETPLDIATAACVLRDGIALGGDLNIIRGTANGLFLAYYLSNKKKRAIARLGQGNSVVHLYGSHLAGLKLRIPSAPEQQKIADFLVNVDERIKLLQQRRDAVQRYKQGMMQRIFAQSIRFKRDDNSVFPDWKETPFAKIAKRASEKFDPTTSVETPMTIELENIESGTGRITGHGALGDQLSLKGVFRNGDILFGKLRPYLNKYWLADSSGVCSSEIWVLRAEGAIAAFVFYLIQTKNFMQSANQSSGSKMPRADWSVVGAAKFSVPHPDEQQKIADFLGALDSKITAVTAQIEQMQTFKSGLLQQMFV